MMAPNLASGQPVGGVLRVPWYSQTPPMMVKLPCRTSLLGETPLHLPRGTWRRRSA
jgi:hypothetical protein